MQVKLVNNIRLKSALIFDSGFHQHAVANCNIKEGDLLIGSSRCANSKFEVCLAQRPGSEVLCRGT